MFLRAESFDKMAQRSTYVYRFEKEEKRKRRKKKKEKEKIKKKEKKKEKNPVNRVIYRTLPYTAVACYHIFSLSKNVPCVLRI